MEELEALNLKVRGSLYSLTKDQLVDVAKFLKLELTGESSMELIAAILKHLDSDALAQKDEDGGLSTVSALEDYIALLTDKPDSTNTKTNTDKLSALLKAMEDDFEKKKAEIIASFKDEASSDKSKETPTSLSLFKTEFKISGQIGEVNQKNRLAYSSLIHQINSAIEKGHSEKEVVEAVIKAIAPGVRLRGYLESCTDLPLTKVRSFLKSHYQEQGASDLYHELSAAKQEKGETPQGFVMRALDLRQKIVLASKDTDTGISYDPVTARELFQMAVRTGLANDNIRSDIKVYLQGSVSDEVLLEQLNVAANTEAKRQQKSLPTKSATRIHAVQADSEAQDKNKKKHSSTKAVEDLTERIDALHVEMASIKSELSRDREDFQQRRGHIRERGCESCKKKGVGSSCQHCFRCGSSEHFARGCRQRRVTTQQGNDQRSRPGDRK